MLERLAWLYLSDQRLFRPRLRWLRWVPWIALALLVVLAIAPRVAVEYPMGAYR